MKYDTWVDSVWTHVVSIWERTNSAERRFLTISVEDIALRLGFDSTFQAMISENLKYPDAIANALVDLRKLELLEPTIMAGWPRYEMTQRGRQIAKEGISSTWQEFINCFLTEDQEAVLNTLVEIGQKDMGIYVYTWEVPMKKVCETLGLDWGDRGHPDCLEAAIELEDMQFLVMEGGRNGERVQLTYKGVVRATRKSETEWHSIIKEQLKHWEGANADFKLGWDLAKKPGKGKLIRTVLALANTQHGARRFVVLGFDDKTRRFKQSVSTDITQDRIENILHAYTEPTPRVAYHLIPWETGTIGIIEVIRETEKVPYKVSRDLKWREPNSQKDENITAGQIFVRHGSHTEEPTPLELASLIAEGNRARQPSNN